MLDDVRRLLDARRPRRGAGARDQRPARASASTALRDEIAKRVAAKKVTRARLEADVQGRRRGSTAAVRAPAGPARCPKDARRRARRRVRRRRRRADRGRRRRARRPGCGRRRATGWPVTAWLSRLRPDPLKRLHLDLGADGKQLTGRGAHLGARRRPRSSGPASTPRCVPLADDVLTPARPAVGGRRTPRLGRRGCPTSATASTPPWPPTDLGADRIAVWAGAGAGAAVAADPRRARRRRLAGRARGDGLPRRCPSPRTPDVGGVPVPTLLLLGGVAARDAARPGVPAARLARPPGRGRARPTGGCATAIADGLPTSWWSRRSRPSWRRTTTVRARASPAPSR